MWIAWSDAYVSGWTVTADDVVTYGQTRIRSWSPGKIRQYQQGKRRWDRKQRVRAFFGLRTSEYHPPYNLVIFGCTVLR